MNLNRKQIVVLWLVAIVCVTLFVVAVPVDFKHEGDDYEFNKLSVYLMNLMRTVPVVLLIGGLAFYLMRSRQKEPAKPSRTILIVDDEKAVARTLELLLQRIGYAVLATTKPETVLDTLAKEEVDLVLLDIRMPGMSGLELLKKIKATYADIPVVMLTALGYDDSAVTEALSNGASGYVKKTTTFSELKLTIDNVFLTR